MIFGRLILKVRKQVRRLASLNGEFVVFSLGTLLLAGGAGWVYPPAGLLVGGGLLIGDVVMGRVMKFKLAQRAGDS